MIDVDGAVVGYVAYEMQADGSGYIDYLAVDETLRGRGLGRALVSTATADLVTSGATHAHLTVREANAAARALYASLDYEEERIAIPYRRGFTLP
ncbi:MAG: GNAT family N-acetyltransferase [Actinomycetota bacterium]